MAYDSTQDQEAQQNLVNGQGSASGGQQTGLSGGGSGFAGGSRSGGSQAQAGPTSSGSWTNLNNYLTANQDQAGALGNQVAGNIQNQASQTGQDLSGLTQAFQNQTPYQTLNQTNQDQVTQAFAHPESYASGDISQPLSYLNASTGNAASDITAFQPTAGQNWQGVSGEIGNLNSALQNTQSEGGRFNLLQNQFGGNGQNYTYGQQKLDQLLLQQDPNNQQQLNSLYGQYNPQYGTPAGSSGSAVPQAQAQALSNAQDYAAKEKAQAGNIQGWANSGLSHAISGLGTNLSNEESQKAAGYSTEGQGLKDAIASGKLSQSQAQTLGIDPNAQIYNLNRGDLSNYLSLADNPYQGQQKANYAASPEDYAQFQGLQRLIGGASGQEANANALNGLGLSGTQALQAPNAYNFDTGGFNSRLQGASAAYQQALTSPQTFTANSTSGPSAFQLTPSELISAQSQNPNNPLIQALLQQFYTSQGTNNRLNKPLVSGGPVI